MISSCKPLTNSHKRLDALIAVYTLPNLPCGKPMSIDEMKNRLVDLEREIYSTKTLQLLDSDVIGLVNEYVGLYRAMIVVD